VAVGRGRGALSLPLPAVDQSPAEAFALALYWTLAGVGAWLRRTFRLWDEEPDLSELDRSIDKLRDARRLIRETRNDLRRATGNPLEPLVFRHGERKGDRNE
jgi:hypothetical protein